MQQPYWWLTYATVACLQQWSAAVELSLFWLPKKCVMLIWKSYSTFRFMDFKQQQELIWENRQRRREKPGESPWTLKMFLKVRQRKEAKEIEQEWKCDACVCVWVRESKKEGFNAAGLSTQSTPALRQDFHVSEGLDSKVKLKRGSSTKEKKALREWDYVHFIHSILEQETKG